MAHEVAEIKRGTKSIEEKADAIGSFVASLLGSVSRRNAVKQRVVPPPISRIRASLQATQASCPTLMPAPASAAPLPIVEIKPPISVRQLAAELGLKPSQIISELMKFNVFANINQTVDAEIASRICERYGFVLKTEHHQQPAAVEKVEKEITLQQLIRSCEC